MHVEQNVGIKIDIWKVISSVQLGQSDLLLIWVGIRWTRAVAMTGFGTASILADMSLLIKGYMFLTDPPWSDSCYTLPLARLASSLSGESARASLRQRLKELLPESGGQDGRSRSRLILQICITD
nr:hypothetical protein [Tanacetum cinerariifolium]